MTGVCECDARSPTRSQTRVSQKPETRDTWRSRNPRRMRTRMGTQSESRKRFHFASASPKRYEAPAKPTQHSIFFRERNTCVNRPRETCESRLSTWPSKCAFSSHRADTQRTVTESSRRVTTFSRPGRAIARRAAGATERTPARVRSARAAKRAEARDTPARGSVVGGRSRETRGNARRRCA